MTNEAAVEVIDRMIETYRNNDIAECLDWIKPLRSARDRIVALSHNTRKANMIPKDGIDWKAVAHRAAGHIDALLLYATGYPSDSHPCEANRFLIQLRQELGIRKPHRTQGQFANEGFCLPLPRLTPTANGSRDAVLEQAAKACEANACDNGCAGVIRALKGAPDDRP